MGYSGRNVRAQRNRNNPLHLFQASCLHPRRGSGCIGAWAAVLCGGRACLCAPTTSRIKAHLQLFGSELPVSIRVEAREDASHRRLHLCDQRWVALVMGRVHIRGGRGELCRTFSSAAELAHSLPVESNNAVFKLGAPTLETGEAVLSRTREWCF